MPGRDRRMMPERNPTATKDLIGLSVVAAAAFVVAVYFDAFEKFERWAQNYEWWQVDELVVVPLVLALAFGFYYWRRQRELKESQERFRSLVQNALDIILVMGADQTVRYVSPAVERVLGYKPEDVVSMNNFTPVHPDDMDQVQHLVAEAVSNPGTTLSMQLRLQHADGSWQWMETRCTSLLEDLAVGGIVFNSRDISERKQAEMEIREAEERYRTLIEQIPAITYIETLDAEEEPDHTLLYVSPQVEAVLGYSPEEWLANPGLWEELLHPEDRGFVLVEDARTEKTGRLFRMEYRMFARDGRVVWVSDEAVLVRGAEGQPLFWQGVMHDITERKQAEEALKESEERFRILAENARDLIYRYRLKPTPGFEYVSPSATTITGYTPEEYYADPELGRKIVHPDDAHLIEEAWGSPGSPLTLRWQRRDGSIVWTELLNKPVYDEVGELVAIEGIARDVTERMKGEEALRRSEERFRSLVQNASDVITIYALDGTVRYVSPAIERMLGYRPEERLGQSTFDILHPDDRERAKKTIADGLREPGGRVFFEARVRHKDGSWRHVEATGANMLDNPGVRGIVFNSREVTERKRVEEELRRSERNLAAAQRIARVGSWEYDVVGGEMRWSDEMCRIFGVEPRSFAPTPSNFLDFIHPEDLERVKEYAAVLPDDADPDENEHRVVRPDGRVRVVRSRREVERDEAGKPTRITGTVQDVTEQKELEERYRTLVEQVPAITYVQTLEHNYTTEYVSPQVEAVLGYAPHEYTSDPHLWLSILHPEDRERVLAEDERTDRSLEPYSVEYRMLAKDGRVVWVQDEARLVRDAGGRPLYWQGIMLDITERKTLERKLEHQAFHDDLTGLPNRAHFAERLEQALARSGEQGAKVAVLFVDIDDFKSVNDSLGHWAGDELLAEFAKRLKASVRPADTVARFGGDEFAVLLEGIAEERVAAEVAERAIVELRREPFMIESREVFATPSIGIALSGYTERGWEDLLRRANLALHRAKEQGKARYACFTLALDERLRARLRLEGELREALEREEFRILYQPKVSIGSGEIAGMEALVRWEHPERGLLAPSEFLALAEETGLIVPIGRWVLREACRQAKEWQERYPKDPPLEICVNLSAKQFLQQGLAGEVRTVLRECGLDPRVLTLEITEDTAMEDAPATTEALRKLKGMGVRIAVDDFGTGYSSLSYLKRFPVDYLKIDQAFVAGLGQDPEDEGIVGAVVELAHTLGLAVVAEGVENGEQLGLLREMGCELAQGSYFWDPLSAEAAGELLAAYNVQG